MARDLLAVKKMKWEGAGVKRLTSEIVPESPLQMPSSSGVFLLIYRARRFSPSRAVGHLGRASAWAARLAAVARGRDGELGRATRRGPVREVSFSPFHCIRNCLSI